MHMNGVESRGPHAVLHGARHSELKNNLVHGKSHCSSESSHVSRKAQLQWCCLRKFGSSPTEPNLRMRSNNLLGKKISLLHLYASLPIWTLALVNSRPLTTNSWSGIRNTINDSSNLDTFCLATSILASEVWNFLNPEVVRHEIVSTSTTLTLKKNSQTNDTV